MDAERTYWRNESVTNDDSDQKPLWQSITPIA